jgi:hypothetical protein
LSFEFGLDGIALGAVAWPHRRRKTGELGAVVPVIAQSLRSRRNLILVAHRTIPLVLSLLYRSAKSSSAD